MSTHVILMLLALLLPACVGTPPPGATGPAVARGQAKGLTGDVTVDTVRTARAFVVPIICAAQDGNDVQVRQIVGTGFFINRLGHFLTAAHVLERLNQIVTREASCTPVIHVRVRETETTIQQKSLVRWFSFKPCRADADLDVAVCETESNPFTAADLDVGAARLDAFSPYDDGTPVAFTGFSAACTIP
jgi:hypothetical protein